MKRIYFILALLLSACSNGDDTIQMPEAVNDPVAVLLVFPEENMECNEGVILSDAQSKVTFKWSVSEYTDSYEVNLQNLDTQNITKIESTTNSTDIILDRGSAYKWYVVSKSDKSIEIAESESWQFYNAAQGVVNYAPFPADATNPISGSNITSSSNKVTLSWEGTDLDDDIVDYEVFYGTANPPTSSSGVLTDTTFELDVTIGSTIYWSVKTRDKTNNFSVSEIFNFTVQ
ncbi:hypothetical protein [uncultured Zobellia sp.]|uniref:hypothetical protein n=1 Tax=uncultured Zobellia sp. TaxID=255433 RepID=UPI00259857E5|nr:hypothetical protein [uncultured Zobellia sp.]